MKLSALVCVAAMATAAATTDMLSYNRRQLRNTLNAQRFEMADSEANVQTQLELLARATGQHVVRGRLHAFSEAEVLEAERRMQENIRGISGWFSKKFDAVKTAWDDVKKKFGGNEADFADGVNEGLQANLDKSNDASKNPGMIPAKSAEYIEAALVETRNHNDKNARLGMLDTLVQALRSNAAATMLNNFCVYVSCYANPSYKSCLLAEPFKTLNAEITANEALKDSKDLTWTAIAKNFLRKATLRILIHGLSVVVKAAKTALDGVPGGAFLNKAVTKVVKGCSAVMASNLYGASCVLNKLADIVQFFSDMFDAIKTLTFKPFVAKYAKSDFEFTELSVGAIVTCIVDKAKAEAIDKMKCTAKANKYY